MATLITEKNEIISEANLINNIITPNFYMPVTFSEELVRLADNCIDDFDKQKIYELLPLDVIEKSLDYRLMPTIVAKIEEPISEHLKTRLKKSETPHINHGNEMHVILQGGGTFGFKLQEKDLLFEVEAGDVIYIDKDTQHWFKLGKSNHLMLASFHQDEFERFHERVEYINIPKAFGN